MEKTTYETIEWYKRDQDSLRKMEEKLESMLGQRSSFNNTMENIKIAQDRTLKKMKRIRVGRRGDEKVQAAEWVDEELRDNIRKRSRLSRR